VEGVDVDERVNVEELVGVAAFVEESETVGDGDGVTASTPLNTE